MAEFMFQNVAYRATVYRIGGWNIVCPKLLCFGLTFQGWRKPMARVGVRQPRFCQNRRCHRAALVHCIYYLPSQIFRPSAISAITGAAQQHNLICNPNWTYIGLGHGLRTPGEEIGRKSNPDPKFLGTDKTYFVCHIGPKFQISLINAFKGVRSPWFWASRLWVREKGYVLHRIT